VLLVPITRSSLDWISRIEAFQGEGFDLCFSSLVRGDKPFDISGNREPFRLCSLKKPRLELGINGDRQRSYNRFYASKRSGSSGLILDLAHQAFDLTHILRERIVGEQFLLHRLTPVLGIFGKLLGDVVNARGH
jgi:hypothetical protein